MAYTQMTLEEKRTELMVNPPPWRYDPLTGTLLSRRGTSVTQTIYQGVYYNPKCIRVWLATGFYPDPLSLRVVIPAGSIDTKTGRTIGGHKDNRLVNIGYGHEA